MEGCCEGFEIAEISFWVVEEPSFVLDLYSLVLLFYRVVNISSFFIFFSCSFIIDRPFFINGQSSSRQSDCFCDRVPLGILIVLLPSNVGDFMVPPNVATVHSMGRLQNRSEPRLSKS